MARFGPRKAPASVKLMVPSLLGLPQALSLTWSARGQDTFELAIRRCLSMSGIEYFQRDILLRTRITDVHQVPR